MHAIMRALAGFAKGTDISGLGILGRQSGCGFLPSVKMEGMKHSMAVILAFCAMASSASANLGENSERIEDRYGTIVQRRLQNDGKVSVVYTKDRYLYMVTFVNSRSVSESYSRANGKDLSEKEITKFLKANSGAKWVPSNTGAERHFKSSDGAAEATYGILNGRPALTVRDLRR
jgi:hypothetical protein